MTLIDIVLLLLYPYVGLILYSCRPYNWPLAVDFSMQINIKRITVTLLFLFSPDITENSIHEPGSNSFPAARHATLSWKIHLELH
jgi:hypothetical protein